MSCRPNLRGRLRHDPPSEQSQLYDHQKVASCHVSSRRPFWHERQCRRVSFRRLGQLTIKGARRASSVAVTKRALPLAHRFGSSSSTAGPAEAVPLVLDFKRSLVSCSAVDSLLQPQGWPAPHGVARDAGHLAFPPSQSKDLFPFPAVRRTLIDGFRWGNGVGPVPWPALARAPAIVWDAALPPLSYSRSILFG